MLLVRKNNNWMPEVPSFFNDWLSNDLYHWNNKGMDQFTEPDVNIKENDKDYQIEVAAPGLKKENFQLEVNKNMLTISAKVENKKEEKKQEGQYYCKEFSYQSFSRSFNLGENLVKEDKIKAKYENGILNVILPKQDESKIETSRMISIS
jgi:HSP20 family protein